LNYSAAKLRVFHVLTKKISLQKIYIFPNFVTIYGLSSLFAHFIEKKWQLGTALNQGLLFDSTFSREAHTETTWSFGHGHLVIFDFGTRSMLTIKYNF